MQIEGYDHSGGHLHDTAALKNLLHHAGVQDPTTHLPLSEPLCLGIAGGIAAGYSFCPSIPGHDYGSGVSVVGRYQVYRTDGSFYVNALRRLGAGATVREAGSEKAAFKHLLELLESGRPAVAWCTSMGLSYLGWAGCLSMYTLVVYGVDLSRGMAFVGHRSPGAIELPLEALAWARNRVCSFKNRVLAVDPVGPLTEAQLRSAVLEGIQACANDLLEPPLKTYNLPGLLEWSKAIANPKNKKGWQNVYPDGNLYPALRDVYDSIETAGTGGGLLRPMYAAFLEEAARITDRPAFRACAATYRSLADQWRDLAETALDDRIDPFARTRALLQERCLRIEAEGAPAMARIEALTAALKELETSMRQAFPLDAPASKGLLETMARKLGALHDAELQAARALHGAAGNV